MSLPNKGAAKDKGAAREKGANKGNAEKKAEKRAEKKAERQDDKSADHHGGYEADQLTLGQRLRPISRCSKGQTVSGPSKARYRRACLQDLRKKKGAPQ